MTNEGLPRVLADLADRADMGMVQSGVGARLAHETVDGLLILRSFLRKELQGNWPSEHGILGAVQHTHAPAADLIEHAIMGNSLSDHAVRSLW
jgi:hypothetical protein